MSTQRKMIRKQTLKQPEERVIVEWIPIDNDVWIKGISALSVLPNAQGWLRKGVGSVCDNAGLKKDIDYIVAPPYGIKGGSKVAYIKGTSFFKMLESYYIHMTAPEVYNRFKEEYTNNLEQAKNSGCWLVYENGKFKETINPNKRNMQVVNEKGESVKVTDMTVIMTDLLGTVSRLEAKINTMSNEINALHKMWNN